MRVVCEQRLRLWRQYRLRTPWEHKLRVLREHHLHTLRVGVISLVAGLLGSGCANPDPVIGPIFDPASYVETMDILEEAITLSTVPGADTVRLHVSTLFGDGSVVSEPIQFTTSDSTVVVDQRGLVTAHFPTLTPALVYASMTYNGATRRDSARILVLPQLPTVGMARFDLRVSPGMSTLIPALTAPTSTQAVGVGSTQLIVQGLDENGTSVPTNEILISVRSTDTTIANVSATGLVTAVQPGSVYIVANTFANGIFATDSIAIRVGVPLYSEYMLPMSEYKYTGIWKLGGDTARIGVGGVIGWRSNDNPTPVDLIFDDTTHMEPAPFSPGFPETGAGHILGFRTIPLLPDGSNVLEYIFSGRVGRKFTAPGVYRFHGVFQDPTIRNQIHGVIIVCPNDFVSCDP